MSPLPRIQLLAALLLSPVMPSAAAEEAAPPAASVPSATAGPLNDDALRKIKAGQSFAPILGYDPTYGVLLGAAYFRGTGEPPVSNLNLLLYGAKSGSFALDTKFKLWNRERVFYSVNLLARNFFDPYFGLGDRTDADGQRQLENVKLDLSPSAWYRLDSRLSVGALLEFNYRNETGVDGNPDARVFGRDFTPVVGLAANYDSRDNEIDSHEGGFYEARTDFGPGFLSNREAAGDFARGQLEARQFWSPTDGLILGHQTLVAATAGAPGFDYLYSFGSSLQLRGFHANRLLGRHAYLTQGEARVALPAGYSTVFFAGVGDVAAADFSDFHGPRFAAGGGLRFALPPDRVAKVRLDYARGNDDSAIYLNFNEAF